MRVSSRLWLLVPVLATVFVVWTHRERARRVAFVTSLDQEAAAVTSLRSLVVPGHGTESYDLIVQTQDLLQRGAWRMRDVNYDNAPVGRPVHRASPVLWYLGAAAWLDHAISGRPLNRAVENAAIYAEPALHFLLLVTVSVLAAWQVGPLAAAVLSLGVAALFPFAGGFTAGAPSAFPLAQACSLGALLLLLIGLRRATATVGDANSGCEARVWFVLAGIAGGCGLWIDPFSQTVLTVGVAAGMMMAAIRKDVLADETRVALRRGWWHWSVAGTATILVACGVDFFPGKNRIMLLEQIHPMHAVMWLGLGGAMVLGLGRGAQRSWCAKEWTGLALVVIAVGALPLMLALTEATFVPRARADFRLDGLPTAVVAMDWKEWFRDGGVQWWATLIPAVAMLPGLRRAICGGIEPLRRLMLTLALGALATSSLAAIFYLKWWQQADVALVLVVVAAVASFGREEISRLAGGVGAGLFALLLLPGVMQLVPSQRSTEIPLTEVNAMLEKDLARWLARRAGESGAVVWAPPDTTAAMHFYGGLRGVGTLAPENVEGLTASVRIARAASAPEAQALLQRRGIGYLVLPSWDSYFEEIVAAIGNPTEGTFFDTLKAGDIPRWLRPVPYQFRRIPGIEDHRVRVFEVVDEQEPVVALSRRVEYHAEMGQLEAAAAAAEGLLRFPADVGALAARVQVCAARNDRGAQARAMGDLRKRLGAGGDRYLSWDRRVSLALVLARENELERALDQARRCVTEMNPERLRSLSPGMLLNLQVLLRALEVPIPDPALRELARELLPFELRRHL